ncbi:threonine aldolase family protein [Lysobacter sp.]|uniref:threonine aldolase family protein n=1 Tax=Lysobacter sp. TaxID=72226 RepID=UPI002D6820B3|nr:beta-eliminating lyase-related protein [Lysobacter sp.]HZX78727.1 beta-eliminating lyase-related protein [Lysobacter sp.]
MDRRQFLAVGGLTAASPVLARSASDGAGTTADPGLFREVNFIHDGLGLSPREYATLLHDATTQRDLPGDNYSNGGVIEELEQAFARKLGKQAAMFVPTGTLANHIALRKLAGQDRRVLVQAESHFYADSGDAGEVLSNLNLIPLVEGRSTVALGDVQRWVELSASGRVPMRVGVLSIESPVRRRDHEMVDFAQLQHVCGYAREQGIRLHLDGARLFNLPYHSGHGVQEYAALFDTVLVSVWKHFNGASGAILAGDASFIEGLYHTRRMFGGSLPQAWPTAAVAMQFVDSYEADYARAWQATDRVLALLRTDRRFKVRKVPMGTSRFFLSVTDADAAAVRERARQQGVLLPRPNPETGEFAMQVNPSVLRTTPETIAQGLLAAAKA